MQGDAAQGPLGLLGLGRRFNALEHQQYAGADSYTLFGVDAGLPVETPGRLLGLGIGRLKQSSKLLKPALATKGLKQAGIKRV
jgi:hypothetical protein